MEQLRTAFIEGTNKQYSIREDGVIIRHFLWNKKEDTLIMFKEYSTGKYRIHIRSNGKGYCFYKNALLAKYFNFIICPKCGKKIPTDKHIRLCKNCMYRSKSIAGRRWREKNPELSKEASRNSYHKFIVERRETSRIKGKRERETISKRYIASKLNISMKNLSDELYELCKIQLQLKRLLSEKTGIPTPNIGINNVKNQKLLCSNRPNA